MYERITGDCPWTDADEDLPRPALLDGRAVGRLRAADDDPGPVRHRRIELLRPRRQPARGQRDDAVPRRRLLHRPAHGHQLAQRHQRPRVDRRPGLRRRRARRPRSGSTGCWASAARRRRRSSTASSARSCSTSAGSRATADGLREALGRVREIREEFWSDLKIEPGDQGINQTLENAGRISDFLELAELMCRDALERDESCGCHLREEHQTDEGEAIRDDERFANAQVWEWSGEGEEPGCSTEELEFERSSPSPGATSEGQPSTSGASPTPARPAGSSATRTSRSTGTPRSSRCSMSSTTASSPRASGRSPSTTTAARASAAPARS